jgi:hypothetical protein
MSIGRCLMRRVLWLVFMVLVVLSGCSGSPKSSGDTTTEPTAVSSSSTTRVPTTTTAATTTTTSTPTTTTALATTTQPTTTNPTTTTLPPTITTTMDIFFSIAVHGLCPAPLSGSGGRFGSGCSPGSDTLPDGIWWGYITDLSPSSITFDLGCLRFADETDDDPATEDYAWVIENSNPKVRVVPVGSDTLVTCDWMYCPPNPFPYGEWIEDDRLPHGDQGRERGLWLYINDGVVTEIGDEGLAG